MPLPLRTGSVGAGLLLAALTVTAQPAEAQKNKPVPAAQATVVLADRVDANAVLIDRLTSDGGGAYTSASIEGEFGDLRLELAGSGRTIAVRLAEPIATAAGMVVPQDETFSSDAVLFVNGLRGLARGQTATRVGRIGLGTSLANHAVGFRYTTAQGIEIYGTTLCVTRRDVAGAVWDIASSCHLDPSDTAGLFEENIRGKVNHRFKATYSVPFALTVTCNANCPP